jgi:hapalindole H/12-epi-hapalindole U/12-epi-fischerindole U synthase
MGIYTRLPTAVLAAGLALAGGASLAVAAPLTVVNPGFEDTTGQSAFNEFTFGTPVGWSIYDPNTITGGAGFFTGTLMPNGTDFFNSTAPEGNLVGILFNSDGRDTGEYGFVQTLTDTLTANTRYELRVQVGNIASGVATNAVFFNLDGFPGYWVELLAGGVVVAQDVDGLVGSLLEGEFLESVVTLDVGAAHAQLGQDLAIRLVNLNETRGVAGPPDLEVDFDDVRLSATAIPVPGGLALMAVAAIIVLRRRRGV